MAASATGFGNWSAITSNLVRRMLLAIRAGMQFGGSRNLYEIYGYPTILKFEDMYAKFSRQDVTKTIVQKPAWALWTNPPEVTANSTFNKAWEELVRRHGVWELFLRVDQLLCFSQFVLVVVGGRGPLSSEGSRRNGLDSILYLQPYGEDRTKIDTLVNSTSDPRFGLPLMYSVSPRQGDVSVQAAFPTIQVHYTNAIHMTNELILDNVYSEPRLQHVYNLLEDLLKVGGGSAETFWITANRGMQVDIDKEMELQAGDEQKLTEELEEFHHQLRRFIRTRGVEITPLGSDTPNPEGVFKVLIALISAATGIPQRILLGAEAGQLASEQDRANWAMYVKERRKSFGEPRMLKPFIQRMVEMGVLPEPREELEIEWPEAFHLSPLERAQTMAQTARAIVNISRQAQFGHPLVTTEEAREILGMPEKPEPPGVELPEPDEVIEKQEKLAQQKITAPGSNRTRPGGPGSEAQGTPGEGGEDPNRPQAQ